MLQPNSNRISPVLALLYKKLLVTSITTGLLFTAVVSYAQLFTSKNYVTIAATDKPADIVSKAARVTPSERQLRWQQLELTAFLHFGMNTYTNREWGDGKENPKDFNPTELDARQWVRVCKEAGIKQVIVTCKHHDGFCLWPSKYTEHSVKSSPWKDGKGDVVKEVADACREYKMGFGVYLSPWDRNSPIYGDNDKYNDYFVNQLTELLSNYGKVDEVWFDGANGEGPNGKKQAYDFNRWYKLIRKLQPGAMIAVMGPDVRWVGTESGNGRTTEWSVVPIDAQVQENIAAGSQKDVGFAPTNMMDNDLGSREKINKAKSLVWYPAETDVSIRPGWFHHPAEDTRVKTPQRLLDIYYSSVGRNSLLLLNIPPDKRGLITDYDTKALKEWRALLDETFAVNFLKGAAVKTSNGKGPKGLTDGNYKTYWTTNGKDTSAVIEFTLKAPQTIDLLALQENITVGQRVEKFVVEYKDGEEWKKITDGTTIGYKRLIKFAPVTVSVVRLRIESSRLNPTISEIGLYKQAAVAK